MMTMHLPSLPPHAHDRGLMDLLAGELHAAVSEQPSGWQLRAAAVVAVAAEMLFGASCGKCPPPRCPCEHRAARLCAHAV